MIVRGQFGDLFDTTALPGIEGAIWEEFNRYPEQYAEYFNVKSTTRDIVQHTSVSGLGNLAQVAENGPVTYDTPAQGFDKTYRPVQWALGFRASRVMFDDDKHDLVRQWAGDLGESARETVETEAANIFNNGFTDTGPDGKVLFATDHPNVKGGGTQANRPTNHADLSVPALQSALTDVSKWKDHSGRLMMAVPEILMVPPDLEWVATEILKGTMRGDTANNTVNAFVNRAGLPSFNKIFVNRYLTDVDAWFVGCEKRKTKMNFFWRERPNTIHDVDFDTRALKTAMWCRFIAGYSDWRGWWGTAGA